MLRAFLPDITLVASNAWGVEVAHLGLIPLFFSILVLIVSTFKLVGVLTGSQDKKSPFALGLLIALLIVTLAHLLRWFVLQSSLQVLVPAPLLFLTGFLSIFAAWVLLFMFFRPSSLTIRSFHVIGVAYATVAYGLLWWFGQEQAVGGILAFVAESLLFVSVSLMIVLLHIAIQRILVTPQ